MLKILLFIAFFAVTMAQPGQQISWADFGPCGPPRPVAPGPPDSFPCTSCPLQCPLGQVCCPLGICGSACFPIFSNCPRDLNRVNCVSSPCLTARCPRFPNAQCRDDFCGGCNAVFTYSGTQDVIPEFACAANSDWPECLATILCPRPPFDCGSGCPRVPDAKCNLTCQCDLAFTDSRTGRLLSAEECGREFDNRCPPIPFRGDFAICSSCPRTCPEGQICCPNGCFGGPSGSSCIPIPRATCPSINSRDYQFTCTNDNNENSACVLFCNSDQFLIGTRRIECQANRQWSHDLDTIRCIRDIDIDRRCPAVQPIRPSNCPVCPSTCPSGQICCPNGCPGSTGCIPIPTPTPPSCPPDQTPVNCVQSPCRAERCPRFPNAICIDDFCGACNAIFIDPDTGDVIPKFACARSSNWPQCLALILCLPSPPSFNCGNACPNQPNAICNMGCDCGIVFTDSRTGDVFSRQDCRGFPSNCPAQPRRRGGCTGIEPTCQRPCPRPLVCCPVGCGSQCIDLSPPTTTPQTTTRPLPTCLKRVIPRLRYICGHHRGIYFCYLRCSSGYSRDGPGLVRCLGGRFSPSMDAMRCNRMTSRGPYRGCSSCGR